MSCEPVLSVKNVGKQYRLYARPEDRIKHMLMRHLGRDYGYGFWALQDISFSVCPGEMLAIIGRNGSGKSTLLQIIAGTLQPTQGEVYTRGKIAALLELGSGFNPEFTGRENIYMNGAILGLTKEEVDEKIDSIIAFAGIGKFVDQPVKYYSSGMFVRLAFAVTTGLEPDILLIDEALAVGDIFFKQKCYRRLESLLQQGVAIVLVTHNMADVEMFATRAMLLDKGRSIYQGDVSEAIRRYFLMEQQEQEARISLALKERMQQGDVQEDTTEQPWVPLFPIEMEKQVRNEKAVCKGILLTGDDGKPRQVFRQQDVMHVYYEFQVLEDMLVPVGGVAIRNSRDILVHGKTALEFSTSIPEFVPKGALLRYHQQVTLNIAPGEYTLEVGLSEILPKIYESRSYLSPKDLRDGLVRLCNAPGAASFMVLPRSHGKPSVLTHRGICDLPGELSLQVVVE